MKTTDKMTKLAREKAALDARLNELQQNLSGEEGRSKAHLEEEVVAKKRRTNNNFPRNT